MILFLLSHVTSGIAQVQLLGRILDEDRKPLENASITLNEKDGERLISYAISDASGQFMMEMKSNSDSLQLKVSYLGYHSKILDIKNENLDLEVVLSENSETLQEVNLKSFPIKKRGDTINYSVSAFTDKDDRVIADVLRKMPGIEVQSGGRILYKGEPIEKYYIEGLDLLEGRYNLANNNLPANAVSRVQILENHQPVKVLDSLVFSEKASLNIKLKKEFTTTGTANLGLGASPLLWKANLTPMLFTKNRQAILSYQSNNTGTDVSSNLQKFEIRVPDRDIFNNPEDFLSLVNMQKPPFSEELWRDNHTHLGSANYLTRQENDLDLKVRLSYVNDRQEYFSKTKTSIYTPTEIINFEETRNNDISSEEVNTGIIIERNLRNSYLKNELQARGQFNTHTGMITQISHPPISQHFKNPISAFQNHLKWLQPLGKQLTTIDSQIGYTQTSEELLVSPGPFPDLLNEGVPYDSALQQVESTNLYTQNSVGLTKTVGAITLEPQTGINFKRQKMKSAIYVEEEGDHQIKQPKFLNDLTLQSTDLYLNTNAIYTAGTWKLRLRLPLTLYFYHIQEKLWKNSRNLTLPAFEPTFFLQKEISPFWESHISVGVNRQLGGIDKLYRGYLLTNVRKIQRYEGPISKDLRQNYRAVFSYRNPLRALFGSFSYTFETTKHNLLPNSRFDQTGALNLKTVEKSNFSHSHQIRLRGSKYFSNASTSIKTGLVHSTLNSKQMWNGLTRSVTSKTLRTDLQVDTEITPWLSIAYSAKFSFFRNKFEREETTGITSQRHLLGHTLYPAENQHIVLDSEYYRYDGKGDFFMNLSYQYTFTKPKMDLNLRYNNIFNQSHFLSLHNNDHVLIRTEYQLRPSQLLLSLRFSF